ncbi:hypothetical protein C7M84_014458 [Penaeus vannamei]|uniref:Neural proliferation differentiation and control protein 1 n=1 Tax=Penaeus vannamei TaxID=6689 RepID=A0A3R7LXV0_PENVA|nr:hypothetical protein C7M84_014458 [Penaeus vannamei]
MIITSRSLLTSLYPSYSPGPRLPPPHYTLTPPTPTTLTSPKPPPPSSTLSDPAYTPLPLPPTPPTTPTLPLTPIHSPPSNPSDPAYPPSTLSDPAYPPPPLNPTRVEQESPCRSVADYPAYGVTGPNKDLSPTSGDRKLAQSAHMYHYQHQKQQMIALEKSSGGERHGSTSDVDSEEEGEENEYTVYECPGLAPTGEMEREHHKRDCSYSHGPSSLFQISSRTARHFPLGANHDAGFSSRLAGSQSRNGAFLAGFSAPRAYTYFGGLFHRHEHKHTYIIILHFL